MTGDGTRVVRAGLPQAVPGQPFLPGPVFAAPYHLDPATGPVPGVDGYGRTDNPTWRGLQIIDLTSLDGPKVIGRAAIYGWPKEMYVRGNNAYVIVSDY